MNILASVEENKPPSDGQKRQEELPCNGHQQREQEKARNSGLPKRAGGLHDGQGEDADDKQQEVLEIIDRPSVGLK